MHALQLASANCTGETFKSGSKKRSTAFISATSFATSFTPTLSSISSRNSTNKRQKTNDTSSSSSNTIIVNGKLNPSIERLAKVMTSNPYANPEHEALSGENGDDYGCDNNNNTTNDDDKEQVKSSNQKAELKSKNKETSKTIQDVESLIYDDSFLPVAYNSTTKKGTERTIEDIKSSKCFEYFGRQLKVGLDNVPTLFTQVEQVVLLPWEKTGNICKYDAKELSTTAWRHFRLSWKDYMNLVILISPLRRDRLILEKIKQLGPPRSINSLRRTFSLGDSRSRRIFFQIYYTPRIAAKNQTRNIELPKTLHIVRRRDKNEQPRGYFQFPYVRNAPPVMGIPPNLNTLHALHQMQNYNNSNGFFLNKHPLYMSLNNANNSSFGSSSNNINNIFHQRTLLPQQLMPPPMHPYNTLNAPMQFPQFQPRLFNSNATMSVNQAINQNDVIDLSNAPERIVSNQPSLSHESSSQSNNNADNKRKGCTKPNSQRGKIVSGSNVAINTNNSNGITKNYSKGLEKKS